MKNLIILIISMLFVASCKTDDTPVPDNNNYYAKSWLPLKKGNTWMYIHNENVNDVITMSVDGSTTAQGLETFYEIENFMGGSSYFSQYDDHTYFMQLAPGMNTYFTTPILNDSEPEGYTVTTEDSFAYPGEVDPALAIFTVEEKDISETLNGNTYRHVIHTSVDIEKVLNDDYSSQAIYDFYFAKGIGLIEIDKSELGYVTDRLTLSNYHLQ